MREKKAPAPRADRVPVDGYPLPLRLPDRDLVLWWGPDEAGTDIVAVKGGRPLTWDTVESCLVDVRARGLPQLDTEEDREGDDEPQVMDLRPVAAWLRGESLALDPESALNLWNLAGDLATSVNASWDDRGTIADNCHTKLTAAAVPFLFGLDQYSPRLTPRQLRYLRTRLLAASAMLRTWLI